MEKSYSASYAAAGVDITAGYRAVELMKKHVARTKDLLKLVRLHKHRTPF